MNGGKKCDFCSMIARLALLLLLLTAGSAAPHKFYVSMTQIDYKAETGNLQIAMRLFTDDLETAINSRSNTELRLDTDKESANADAQIEAYLREHFLLQVEAQRLEWAWVGKEYENDLTWCYLEVSEVQQLNALTVEHTTFTEVFAEQANMVDVTANGEIKSLLLRKDAPTGTVTFNSAEK